MFRTAITVLALAMCATAVQAQTAQEIVAAADKVRNPDKPFRVTAAVTEYRSGTAVDRNVFDVFSKLDPQTNQFRDIMLYVSPPRDAGKMLLLNADNLWFYDPASRQSVRISPQEKLTGEASAGDVLTENLAANYAAAILGSESVEDASHRTRPCWHLDLKAAGDAATYNRVEYWVAKEGDEPVKAKFYADSGGLLKVLYYRLDGASTPSQAIIIDAVNRTLVTTVDFAAPHFQDIPDEWFQRDYLPHLKIE